MAIIIGGVALHFGKNNLLIGGAEDDIVFGDPYTTGNFEGIPEIGGFLQSGKGGNDLIHGLGGFDFLVGDAAEIAGTGRGGDDVLFGGVEDDTVIGDADVNIRDHGRGGNDWLDGGDGNDSMYGDVFGQLDDDACGGNDFLQGAAGNDSIQGDGLLLVGRSRGGDDTVLGGAGRDGLFGDGTLFDHARGGNDYVDGGSDNDGVYGDDFRIINHARGGNDIVIGGAGDDQSVAGDGIVVQEFAVCGDDVVIGGTGNDRLYGDADPTNAATDLTNVTRGHDRFVFASGSGQDTIFDFQNDFDRIDLRGFAGIDGFGDLSAGNITQLGADTRIDLGAAAGGAANVNVLILAGFSAGDLNGADFLFG